MKKYKLKKGIIVQKNGQLISIFDGENSILLNFNNTATFIFNKMKLGWDQEKIVEGIKRKYNIPQDLALQDFSEFITELKEHNIIE